MERNKCYFEHHTSQWPNPPRLVLAHEPCPPPFYSTMQAASPFPIRLKRIPGRPEQFLYMWFPVSDLGKNFIARAAPRAAALSPSVNRRQHRAGREKGKCPWWRKVINVQELQFSFRQWEEGRACIWRGCKAWFCVNSKQNGALHLLTRAGYC